MALTQSAREPRAASSCPDQRLAGLFKLRWPKGCALTWAEWVLNASEALFEAAGRLTRAAGQLFALPGVHYVNVIGRNLLSQRIARKLFLLRDWVGQPEGIQGEITAAVEEFERNLQELSQDGRNLPELSAQLQEVGRQWQQFMSTLAPEISHTPARPADPRGGRGGGSAAAPCRHRGQTLRTPDFRLKPCSCARAQMASDDEFGRGSSEGVAEGAGEMTKIGMP